MTAGREVGELLVRAFDLYRRNLWLVLALTVPIVVVVIGVSALGLGELGAHYRARLPARELYVQLAAAELVAGPLIACVLARWVLLKTRGEHADATDLLANALEVFPAALLAIVAWLAAFVVGLSFLIIPGIYVFVSWYFVVQAVVIDGDRGFDPIRRSAALVRGAWWRSAAVLLALFIVVAVPSQILALAFEALARSANSEAVVVAGNVVGFSITLPFLAIGVTLYYLRLRENAPAERRY